MLRHMPWVPLDPEFGIAPCKGRYSLPTHLADEGWSIVVNGENRGVEAVVHLGNHVSFRRGLRSDPDPDREWFIAEHEDDMVPIMGALTSFGRPR